MKFLNKPWVKTALIALFVVIMFPMIRPTLQKIPVLGAYI
jgi:hypothetical protein